VLLAGVVCPSMANAQWGFWPADSLLAAGRLSAAESAYYAATRQRPRDPGARAALGRYLAARGAIRVGIVLLDEARFFGGDSAALARILIPLYARAGSYGAMDSLRPDLLSRAERRRVQWLAAHPPDASLRDSIVIVSYRPVGDGRGLGTVIVRVGNSELPAMIDPAVRGLALPAGNRADIRAFGAEGRTTLGVADVMRIGGATFRNVPASLAGPDDPVRIGFDVLAAYSPTFDPAAGLLTLRRADRRARAPVGPRVPALFDENGLRVLIGDRWTPTSASMAALLLATRRWMWDARRGDIVMLSGAAASRP